MLLFSRSDQASALPDVNPLVRAPVALICKRHFSRARRCARQKMQCGHDLPYVRNHSHMGIVFAASILALD